MPPRVVVLDNYDSYTFNLVQALGALTGEAAHVFRNDEITLEALVALSPTHLVISPGPGNPEDPAWFGVCREALLHFGPRTPTLGVCLGHQGIGAALGGRVVRAPSPRHGKTSPVLHNGSALFHGLPSPFEAMRYHSLVLEEASLPPVLRVTARTPDGVVMAVQHESWPLFGVQFHPESIGTPFGLELLRNFVLFQPTLRSAEMASA
jgi:anthranilate synthase/aminodeoxychorismate synthase-like glutamine amidotransferase